MILFWALVSDDPNVRLRERQSAMWEVDPPHLPDSRAGFLVDAAG